ncbi:MAG: M16 family metallopeptidase [Campylobacteraceae bacterium]
MLLIKKFLKLVFIISLFFSLSNSKELSWYSGSWAHEESDLKPDPNITFGRLDNGLRFAIIPNKLPLGRVTMYLNVQAGSLMEESYERGFAHFVEHMLFNGSKNFPAGSLIPFFQKNGMSFGGDTNAHTTFAETVYKLNLAHVDDESLDTGLLVLRDFADGALFEEHEVEEEIGVILAEKNARESEASLAGKERRELIYNGTKFADDVIGVEDTIKSANSTNLRAFYEKWYKPQSMILVIVGDIDSLHVKEKIEKTFNSMKKDENLTPIQDFGDIKTPELQVFFQKRPIDGLGFSITTFHPRVFYPDNKKNLQESFLNSIASYAFAQRLRQVGLDNPSLWTVARFQNSAKQGLIPSSNLIFTSDEKNWNDALNRIVKEFKSAQQFGFSDDEISEAIKIISRSLEKNINDEKSRQSSDITNAFVSVANQGRVFTSATEDQKLFDEFLPNFTKKEVDRVFKEAFEPKNRTIFVSGKANITTDEITKAWNRANSQEIAKYEDTKYRDFPYLKLPNEVKDLPKLSEKKLGGDAPTLFFATYKDSLDIYLIPSELEKNKVLATFIFGEDKPFGEDLLALTRLTSSVLSQGGIGDLSPLEVTAIFGGKGIGVSEGFGSKNSVISGSSSSADVVLMLQALWTQYTDPVIKESSYTKVKQSLELNQYNKDHSVDGVDKYYSSMYFYGNSNRFKDLDLEDTKKYTIQDMQNLLLNQRKFSKKAKIVISGDFNKEEVLKTIVQLFGEHKKSENIYSTDIIPATFKDEKTVRNVDDKVDKSVVYKVYNQNIDDVKNRKTLAIRNLMAAVIRDRMRKEIREGSAIAYSPSANYRISMNEADDGYGLLFFKVATQTKYIDEAEKKIDEIIDDLIKNGITKDELDRLKAPMITSVTTNMKRINLWHNLIQNEINYDLPFIEWQLGYENLLNSINETEVLNEFKEITKNAPSTLYIITSQGNKSE